MLISITSHFPSPRVGLSLSPADFDRGLPVPLCEISVRFVTLGHEANEKRMKSSPLSSLDTSFRRLVQ